MMLTKGLKVVALISGGKDSCYNMVQCVREGHTIVALANLRPKDKDELDSYMFQTVGHHVIDLYGQAMGLPLYRRTLEGSSLEQGADYSCTPHDEVEDLYELLREVKEKEGVNAVSVGAILSDYQRVRVENVCLRLGLTPLAYLWRRDQEELLAEMVSAGVNAVLIKVAALGLNPHRHLGQTLAQIYPHMMAMKNKFGLNVCGEGGEYETFTLDCSLFKKKIVIDKQEMVMHSDDTIAPVGYLNFLEAHLEDKEDTEQVVPKDLSERSIDLLNELFPEGIPEEPHLVSTETCCDDKSLPELSSQPESYCHAHCNSSGHFWVTGVMGWVTNDKCIKAMTSQAMDDLTKQLRSVHMETKDLAVMYLYVRNMEEFALVNQVYKEYFSINPPARVCLEVNLPPNVGLRLACYGHRPPGGGSEEDLSRSTMHVQGLSHWAPANIGPYSQAVRLGDTLWVAGQIGMVPTNLDLVPGLRAQCRLSLQHVARVLRAMRPGARLHHVLTGVCYVTTAAHAAIARGELEVALKDSSEEECDVESDNSRPPPSVQYVTVPHLPKGALVEWQVCAATSDLIHSGRVNLRADSLASSLDYRYIPAPHHLMSYTLTIDNLSEEGSSIDQYQRGLRLAADTMTKACHQLSEDTQTEMTDVFRGVQVFYTQGQVKEDLLYEGLQRISSSPCVLPAPVFVPAIDLNSSTRIMTFCS